MLNIFVLVATMMTGALLLYPKLAHAPLWRATITPLASIIGSGFLVLGPILDTSFGGYAPLMMALLCLGAYVFGGAIRFNMNRLGDDLDPRSPLETSLEQVASWALAFAYVISVAYYLNLLGAFSVSMTSHDDAFHARLVTTAVFCLILIVGWTHGFGALERMEQIAVGLKLAIIAGLLAGLAWFFADALRQDTLSFAPATLTGLEAIVLCFGLIVTVQGFETCRYLGAEYPNALRVQAMRLAQGVSTVIYMAYILLLTFAFHPGTLVLSETAIIDLMAIVAPILPILLIAAAISAQFSAAVADTSGSGGLLAELTKGRITVRAGYALLVVIGLLLTWRYDVFQIISYASRAFALYYAIQALIAAKGAYEMNRPPLQVAGFLLLFTLGMLIAVFGAAIE